MGDDLNTIAQFLAPGRDSYSAADVVESLLKPDLPRPSCTQPMVAEICCLTLRQREASHFAVLLGEQVAQPIEPALPLRAVVADPLLQASNPAGFDAAGAHPAQLLRVRQPALLQDLQVLRHRGQGDAQRRGQGRNRQRARAEPVEHCPPRGVAEGVKQPVDVYFTIGLHSRASVGSTRIISRIEISAGTSRRVRLLAFPSGFSTRPRAFPE